jgi:hypothetical protein
MSLGGAKALTLKPTQALRGYKFGSIKIQAHTPLALTQCFNSHAISLGSSPPHPTIHHDEFQRGRALIKAGDRSVKDLIIELKVGRVWIEGEWNSETSINKDGWAMFVCVRRRIEIFFLHKRGDKNFRSVKFIGNLKPPVGGRGDVKGGHP